MRQCETLYHVQITALLFLPDFPGWLAPLHFNAGRNLPSLQMRLVDKPALQVLNRMFEEQTTCQTGLQEVFAAAVRFEELAIFILTLSVSWVSACGLVGGYRSHATRGQCSSQTPRVQSNSSSYSTWPQAYCLHAALQQ